MSTKQQRIAFLRTHGWFPSIDEDQDEDTDLWHPLKKSANGEYDWLTLNDAHQIALTATILSRRSDGLPETD